MKFLHIFAALAMCEMSMERFVTGKYYPNVFRRFPVKCLCEDNPYNGSDINYEIDEVIPDNKPIFQSSPRPHSPFSEKNKLLFIPLNNNSPMSLTAGSRKHLAISSPLSASWPDSWHWNINTATSMNSKVIFNGKCYCVNKPLNGENTVPTVPQTEHKNVSSTDFRKRYLYDSLPRIRNAIGLNSIVNGLDPYVPPTRNRRQNAFNSRPHVKQEKVPYVIAHTDQLPRNGWPFTPRVTSYVNHGSANMVVNESGVFYTFPQKCECNPNPTRKPNGLHVGNGIFSGSTHFPFFSRPKRPHPTSMVVNSTGVFYTYPPSNCVCRPILSSSRSYVKTEINMMNGEENYNFPSLQKERARLEVNSRKIPGNDWPYAQRDVNPKGSHILRPMNPHSNAVGNKLRHRNWPYPNRSYYFTPTGNYANTMALSTWPHYIWPLKNSGTNTL